MALSKKQQKVVDTLVRRVELCREFMNDWMLFNQILTRYPEPGINKAELETQFLKIKSKLARTHKVLKETLADDYHVWGVKRCVRVPGNHVSSLLLYPHRIQPLAVTHARGDPSRRSRC